MKGGLNIDTKEWINKIPGDHVIRAIVVILLLFSILLVYSASSSLAFKEHTTNFAYLLKQGQFVVMGLAALGICYMIPLGWYRLLAYPAFILSVILLILLPIMGEYINGARRWLNFGGIRFQPTEIAKIAVILYLARALELNKFDTYKEFFLKIVLPAGIVFVLILIGSVSTALFIALLTFVILFIAGIKWKYLLRTAGIGAAGLTVLVLLHLAFGIFPRLDTATSRLKKFFIKTEISEQLSAEEKQKAADKTFQADMAKIAVSSVGILGKGPGKSTQRYVLPHPYSDYIYTIIIEEYGLAGGVFVLMLYLWFLFRCIILVKSCTKIFTAITVAGLGLLITIQAMLHILVNVGILPVTGHTLPLLSLGGTSLVILSCAFGIILSVSRTIDISTARRKELQRKEQESARRKQEQEKTAGEGETGEITEKAG